MLLRIISGAVVYAETFKPCVDGSHRAAEGARDLGFLHAFSDKSAERLIILRAPGLASVFSAAAFFAIELLYRVKVIEYELLSLGLIQHDGVHRVFAPELLRYQAEAASLRRGKSGRLARGKLHRFREATG